MKSLSIYTLTRNQSIEHISKLERQLSGRKFPLKIRTWEWGSMRALAAQLEMHMQEVYSLRFFYSFQIPRLGKEFDLLQIKDNHIVNIELKSGVVSDQAIRKQLIQNRYYLSVLGRPIQSYTYISSQNRLVRLTHHDHIVDADWERLCEDLQKEGTNYEGNIEDLFRAELYLISPITDPVRFLKKEYFLTSQQRDIEKKILRDIYAKQSGCFWFSGIPGTGKTLLLYDIAMKLSVRHRICMVHCEENGEKWRILHERLQRIDFLADEQIRIEKKSGSQNSGQDKGPDSSRDYDQKKQFNYEERKAGTQIPLEKYRGILVDEAHLLFTQGNQGYSGKNQLDDIIKRAKVVVIVFDENQILRMDQYWEKQMIDRYRNKAIEQQNYITLTKQLRMQADNETLAWIDAFTKKQIINKIPHHDYEIKIFDSPEALDLEIKKKASSEKSRLSRVIANYDWDYKKGKKPEDTSKKYWEVDVWIENQRWHKPWNYELEQNLNKDEKKKIKEQAWAEQAHTIGEVGSTYTIQGFDLNYAGVILGKSVKYRDGKIIYDPSETSNGKVTKNRTMEDGSKKNFAQELLKHEIRVLMTRGVNGLYIYACDEQLREALKKAAEQE